MGEAANRQIELNERIFEDYQANDRPWMRGIAEEAMGISRRNAERAGALSDYQLESMRFNDNRYRNVGIPFEDQLLQDVNRFDSAGYKNQQVASAMADVQSGFSGAAEQQRRGLARMGVNPNSGRSMAMGNAMGFEQAKAMANAANKTRMAADQVGLSSKMQMYGGMRGLAGLGNTSAGLAMNSMSTGNQSGAGMTNAGSSFLNANNAAAGSFNQGMSAGIQGMGAYTSLGQRAAQINNEADPFASILGAGAQIGAAYLGKSDRRLKADIVHVGEDARTGLSLYEFRYTDGTQRFRGVMADEVLAKYPAAVVTMDSGYLAVNYTMLGLEMVAVEGEYA